jgi:hypothetical protein
MRNEKGLSLVELLVVLLSLMVVMAMGFDLLRTSGHSVSIGLSQSTKAERLRFLQRRLVQDLQSRLPGPANSAVDIESASPVAEGTTLLRTQILQQKEEAGVDLFEVVYKLEQDPPGSGHIAVTRTVDASPTEGLGDMTRVDRLFNLTTTETLSWQAVTGPGENQTSIEIQLIDNRFGGYVTSRRILVPGGTR